MINEKLIDAFLINATKEELIRGIKAVISHFKIDSEYAFEERLNNLIDTIGENKLPTIEDIDINILKDNLETYLYKAEEVDKDSIKIVDITYIDKSIKIQFKRNSNTYFNYELIKYENILNC